MEKLKKIMNDFLSKIDGYRFVSKDEKELQDSIEELVKKLKVEREYSLGEKGIIDFYKKGVGFEVKIGGSKSSIYRQCERYCEHEDIKLLVLITSVPMNLPEKINDKPCFVYNLN